MFFSCTLICNDYCWCSCSSAHSKRDEESRFFFSLNEQRRFTVFACGRLGALIFTICDSDTYPQLHMSRAVEMLQVAGAQFAYTENTLALFTHTLFGRRGIMSVFGLYQLPIYESMHMRPP